MPSSASPARTVSTTGMLVLLLVLQVLAQTFIGTWGAAAVGVLGGLLRRGPGAFRINFAAAAGAALLLLIMVALRGENLMPFADRVGRLFSAPGLVVLLLSVMLPAIQAGALGGAVARLFSVKA
jgi:hypothetical protein